MTKTIFFAAALLACTYAIAEEEPAIDPATTWDLTELYPSVDAWNEAREDVFAEFDKIGSAVERSATAPTPFTRPIVTYPIRSRRQAAYSCTHH